MVGITVAENQLIKYEIFFPYLFHLLNTNTNTTNTSELVGMAQVRRNRGALREILVKTQRRERVAAVATSKYPGE